MNKFLKVIFIFVIAIFCISLVGCTTPEKPDDNKPTQEELRKTVSQKVDNYLKTIIPEYTDKSIELPEECEIEEDKYCYIEWETNHKATISNKGVYKANLFELFNIGVITLFKDSFSLIPKYIRVFIVIF